MGLWLTVVMTTANSCFATFRVWVQNFPQKWSYAFILYWLQMTEVKRENQLVGVHETVWRHFASTSCLKTVKPIIPMWTTNLSFGIQLKTLLKNRFWDKETGSAKMQTVLQDLGLLISPLYGGFLTIKRTNPMIPCCVMTSSNYTFVFIVLTKRPPVAEMTYCAFKAEIGNNWKSS